MAPFGRFEFILLHEACWLAVSLEASKRQPRIACFLEILGNVHLTCTRFGGCRLCASYPTSLSWHTLVRGSGVSNVGWTWL